MHERDNAAARDNIYAITYNMGAELMKEKALAKLGPEIERLHRECLLHIHDLDTFGNVYNCSMPMLEHVLFDEKCSTDNEEATVYSFFSRIKNIIVELATNQSGGIGINNFDELLSRYLEINSVKITPTSIKRVRYCIGEFLTWINISRTRCCREPYYVTLNLGIDISEWGRRICALVLDEYYNMPIEYTRPNIVFKVSKQLHLRENSTNADLYEKAALCTGRRMNPTYLLTDSTVNSKYDAKTIGIMGCRTRVASNVNGPDGSTGRGNIGNVSINLPRIALSCADSEGFFSKLDDMLNNAYRILRLREEYMIKSNGEYLQFVLSNGLWNNIRDVNQLLEQGTYSIGYIGLSETVEILTGHKIYSDEEAYELAVSIIKRMREYVDEKSLRDNRNISLLASPGEMISGRFCAYDQKKFNHDVHKKGYYTNSFHVDVDAGLPVIDKLIKEAPFHELNNGGCISYIEIREAIRNNTLAIKDIIKYAIDYNLSYLGFNFPLDICRDCGLAGTFDVCPSCSSKNIKRIRRVSGYLEDLDFFTTGKKNEVKKRIPNVMS